MTGETFTRCPVRELIPGDVVYGIGGPVTIVISKEREHARPGSPRWFVQWASPDVPIDRTGEGERFGALDGRQLFDTGDELVARAPRPGEVVTCRWFALCDHPAVGLADSGPGGMVPVCRRCADRLGVEVVPVEGWPSC